MFRLFHTGLYAALASATAGKCIEALDALALCAWREHPKASEKRDPKADDSP